MKSYYTIVEDDPKRIKILAIAVAMGLNVFWMTRANSINYDHLKNNNTYYYLKLEHSQKWTWDIIDSYHISGKLISNVEFISAMYEYSELKETT